MTPPLARALALASTVAALVACSSTTTDPTLADATADAARPPEQTGQACRSPADCYPGLASGDGGALKGDVQCLDRVTNGYCTHLCDSDADCCAAPGECKTGLRQVCAPFESTGKKMCFLSCEPGDVAAGIAAVGPVFFDTGAKEDAYCKSFASQALGCRSTGGGKENRKVCLP